MPFLSHLILLESRVDYSQNIYFVRTGEKNILLWILTGSHLWSISVFVFFFFPIITDADILTVKLLYVLSI